MSLKKAHRTLLVAAPALALAAVLGGCAKNSPESFEAISSDLSPNKTSLSERPVDITRNLSMMSDQNLRSMYNDLGRTFYTESPSRLSPYPMTNLSGQPR